MKRFLHAATLFTILLLIMFSLVWLRYSNLYSAHLDVRTATFQSQFESTVHTFQLVSQTIADEILRQLDITSLVHTIVTSEGEERNNTRSLLYQKLSPMYERVSRHSIRQLHFHFPDGRSMLRFHAPHKADDDLTPFRSSVVMANNEQRPIHGYESGRIVHGFRHVYPLSHNGNTIGTVEISNSFQQIRQELEKHNSDDSYYSLMMLKTDLWHKLSHEYQELYHPSYLSPLYLYENSELKSHGKRGGLTPSAPHVLSIFNQLKEQPHLQQGLLSQENFTLTAKWQDTTHSVLFYSIKNIDGHHAAYILSTRPEPYIDALKNNLIVQLSVAFGVALMLTLLQIKLWRTIDKQKKTRDFLHTLTEHMGEGLYATDAAGKITYMNHKASQLLGIPIQDALHHNAHTLFHYEDAEHQDQACPILNTVLNNKTYEQQQNTFKTRNNLQIPVQLTCTPIKKNGAVGGTITLFHDISERYKQEQELEEVRQRLKKANLHLSKLAHIDGLTEIANRRMFDQSITKVWKSSIRHQLPLSLLMIDIDHFKAYNDYYGHLQGDECLRKVAIVLQRSCFRPEDVVARYGGEEFAVLLPYTESDEARQIAERISRNLRNEGLLHKASPISDRITVSIGLCSLIPERQDNLQMLIDCADNRLYLAKQQGRNRICDRDNGV